MASLICKYILPLFINKSKILKTHEHELQAKVVDPSYLRDRSLSMAGGWGEAWGSGVKSGGGASKIFWGSKSRPCKNIRKPSEGIEKISPYKSGHGKLFA